MTDSNWVGGLAVVMAATAERPMSSAVSAPLLRVSTFDPLASVPYTSRASQTAPSSVTLRAVAGTSARLSCAR